MGRIRAGTRPAATLAAAALLAAGGTAGCTADPSKPDVDTGPRRAPAWSVELPAALGRPRLGQTTRDAVVVQGEKGVAVLARSDGALRWQKPPVAWATPRVAGIAGNIVAVEYGDRLELIDLTTGTERARVPWEGPGAPARVTADGIYVSASTGANRPIVAYDLAGNRRWQHDFTGVVELARPAEVGFSAPFGPAPGGQPVAMTVRPGANDPFAVVILAPDTGAEIRRFAGPNGFDRIGTPAVRQVGGALLVFDDGNSSGCATTAATYDPVTGANVWTGFVGLYEVWRTGKDPSCQERWTPRVAGDRLLTTDPAGTLRILGAGTAAYQRLGPATTYPLAATADTVLGRAGHANDDLVAVDVTNGAERWRWTLPGSGHGALEIVNRENAAAGDAFVLTISVPADDPVANGRVTVVDARTGKRRWSTAPRGNLLGASDDGVVTWTGDKLDDDVPHTVNYFPLQ